MTFMPAKSPALHSQVRVQRVQSINLRPAMLLAFSAERLQTEISYNCVGKKSTRSDD